MKDDLVSLADLFGIATYAAGRTEIRDGIDLLGTVLDGTPARECLFGYHEEPGKNRFKVMARYKEWKYIYMANGGKEQLFDLKNDPNELHNMISDEPYIAEKLREMTVCNMKVHALFGSAVKGDSMKAFDYEERKKERIYQFDLSKGVTGYEY